MSDDEWPEVYMNDEQWPAAIDWVAPEIKPPEEWLWDPDAVIHDQTRFRYQYGGDTITPFTVDEDLRDYHIHFFANECFDHLAED